ncbi:MAG: hypothetical protein EOP47_19325 [Sphingobacteriaceae bacterium]|nr:MAG: hypothetical protein EOP47_19325 [Sphingobacteriaceae bacterium]
MSKATLNIIDNGIEDPSITHLRIALKLSYKERFLMATRLYKINKTMQKATITHKPFISK